MLEVSPTLCSWLISLQPPPRPIQTVEVAAKSWLRVQGRFFAAISSNTARLVSLMVAALVCYKPYTLTPELLLYYRGLLFLRKEMNGERIRFAHGRSCMEAWSGTSTRFYIFTTHIPTVSHCSGNHNSTLSILPCLASNTEEAGNQRKYFCYFLLPQNRGIRCSSNHPPRKLMSNMVENNIYP